MADCPSPLLEGTHWPLVVAPQSLLTTVFVAALVKGYDNQVREQAAGGWLLADSFEKEVHHGNVILSKEGEDDRAVCHGCFIDDFGQNCDRGDTEDLLIIRYPICRYIRTGI